jgi:dipeptidyl aminopeptidase/acylaminoacyl peptidase
MRSLITLLLSAAAISAAPSFTLEQVLSSPFPSGLVASGKRVAWVQRDRGVRNIWVAESPEFKARQVTSYKNHDGIEIADLTFSSDGNVIVFVRGEGANGKGEFPNPEHLVAGVGQVIDAVPFAGGEVKELGHGNTPAIAPDGKTVAFVSGGQVWSAPLDGSGKAEQLIHARGNAQGLVWSPDGKHVAMTSSRTQHSFIAVYTPGNSTLQYLDPSVDFDDAPVWSPDSKSVAFIRRPTSQDPFAFGPKRANDVPWSIRVANVESGEGRQIWRAEPGPGSEFREDASDKQLLWAADDKIVFPWERTGWLHLYAISTKGDRAIDLTPGEFEIENVALSEDRKSIVYSSNQGDIERRHIWRVSVNGGPKAVTQGSGIEWSPVFAGDSIALLHSDAKKPARAAALVSGKMVDLAPESMPSDFPAPALTDPQLVVFPAADGMPIHGQIFLPQDGKAKHPAVVFFHGGSRRQMLLGWHYMFYYHQAYAFNQYMASQGYVVLSVNYRSGTGYGLNFREALHYGATGGSEYNDVVGAGLYLRSRPDVIPNKIGLWGGSYGGYLTALGLARASNLFAAGVDLHGVHEWNDEINNFIPSYEPEKKQELARVAFLSSPMAYVNTWKSPVLLIHGDDDRNVNFKQTEMLAEALRKQGVEFEQLIFPDEIHDLLMHKNWLEAYQAADRFLAKHLMAE